MKSPTECEGMLAETIPDDVQRLVDRDRLRMLYDQAPVAVYVTIVAAVGLVVSATYGELSPAHWWWSGIILTVMLSCAALQAVYAAKERRRVDDGPSVAEVARWRLAYGVLVVCTGAMFALWPLLFFPAQEETRRLAGALILGSLAGGSVVTLSSSRIIALSYGALMILSYSLVMIVIGSFAERVCGFLGLMYWAALVVAVNTTYQRLSQSLVLSRRNAMLVEQLDGRGRELLEANQQLAATQDDLRATNQQLEARILERTAELHRLATRDSLTGLANRSRLAELAAAHLRDGEAPLALFFIDLDGFKEINDSMGHAVGDAVLAEVGARLANGANGSLAISRWGGDEFVVLRRCEASSRLSWAELEVRYAEGLLGILRKPIGGQSYSVRVDACIGIAHWPHDGSSLQDLIYNADLAVYSAKAEGRGTIRPFDDALAVEGTRKLRLRKELVRELAEGCPGLSLVYQPIFGAGGVLFSAEALLRWRHAQLGPISPAEFIPLAERGGEILALGHWVLREACGFAAGFEQMQLPSISVNVSVQQLLHSEFADDLRLTLADTGLAGRRLILELTESVFIADYERITAVFRELESLQVRIAIDDFGTGYSSLSYLQRLPAKVLKIDGSFVRAFDTGAEPIIAAGISLGHTFGMQVVAEGIENADQLEALRALGVDAVQGYWLGMPQSGDEFRNGLVDGVFRRHTQLSSPGVQPGPVG